MSKKWSSEEKDYLREFYPRIETSIIAKQLKRSTHSVHQKAFQEGLNKDNILINWTASEIQFLREKFFRMKNKELAAALGIRITSVRMKCYQIGLRRNEVEYWTKNQIEYLKNNYRTMGDVELAERLNIHFPKKRRWTKKQVNKKRQYLNLHRTQKEIETLTFNAVSDKEVAVTLAKSGRIVDHQLKNEYLRHPTLIAAKRAQLNLQRTIKKQLSREKV